MEYQRNNYCSNPLNNYNLSYTKNNLNAYDSFKSYLEIPYNPATSPRLSYN